MVPLKDQIRDEMAAGFHILPGELTYLAGGSESSDGIVYTFTRDSKKYVLKIACKGSAQDVDYAKQKLVFARYLGEHDVRINCPLPGQDNVVFQTYVEDTRTYIASIAEFVDGSCPETKELTDEVLRNWGKLTGKLHAVTKHYPLWENLANSMYRYGYEEEIDFFYNWCRNDIVKEQWLRVKQQIQALPITRDTYGFIHNDNHQKNIILQGKDITLIDFDCATCNFMMHDIFLPIQGSLFDYIGGFERPISDPEPIKRFFSSFLSGYEAENHIDDSWLRSLQLFLDYRRLLLYTVMQDWMESDKKVGESFLHMIANPCTFGI